MTDKPTYNRILVVDDEEGIRKALRIKLSKQGYEVVEAEDGVDASEILKDDHRFDMILSDVKMPKMNGLEFVEWTQEQGLIIPVVMLTGFIDLDTAVAAMKAGAFDYLTKPVKSDALLAAIKKATRHKLGIEEKIEEEEEDRRYREELEGMVKSQARTIIAMMDLDKEGEYEEMEPRLILVAEPDAERLDFISKKLKSAGYKVATASDGQEALEKDLGAMPHMIIAGYKMPNLDGVALTELVKSREATSHMKVVLTIPESLGLDEMKDLKNKGVDDFIKMPAGEEELLAKVALQIFQDQPEQLLETLKDKGAFSGMDFKVDIFDFVQFLIMNRRRVILEVTSSDRRKATLYLDRGNIVHAKMGNLEGPEAFFEAMKFPGGTFSTMPYKKPEKATIEEVGDFLLMEAAKLKDEME